MQADEFLEDILSMDGTGGPLSSSEPASTASSVAGDCALLSDADIHALAKDRQKKDNHNMSMYLYYLFTLMRIKIAFIVFYCREFTQSFTV